MLFRTICRYSIQRYMCWVVDTRAVINKSIDDEVADAECLFPIFLLSFRFEWLSTSFGRRRTSLIERDLCLGWNQQAIQVLPSTTLCVCTTTTNDRTKRRVRETKKTVQKKTARKDGNVRSNKEKNIGREIDNDLYDVDDIQVPVV